jgi:hypothetical protein
VKIMDGARGKYGRKRLGSVAAAVAAVLLVGTGCATASASSERPAEQPAPPPAGQQDAGDDSAKKKTPPAAKQKKSGKAPDVVAQAGDAGGFTVLQMNLCNSGKAKCYEDGKSVQEGIDRIREVGPDVVTLNEVCRQDVAFIARETGRRGVFQAAKDSNGGLYKCSNGQDYGVGVVGGSPDGPAPTTRGGWYPQQDSESSEQRAYLCATFTASAASAGYTACTTHLALNGVAHAQCTGSAWPLQGRKDEPVVLGGDLNLKYGGSPDVQDCVPPGFFRKGYTTHLGFARGVQHVMAADAAFSFSRQETLSMDHTDHPAFAVYLTRK